MKFDDLHVLMQKQISTVYKFLYYKKLFDVHKNDCHKRKQKLNLRSL